MVDHEPVVRSEFVTMIVGEFLDSIPNSIIFIREDQSSRFRQIAISCHYQFQDT